MDPGLSIKINSMESRTTELNNLKAGESIYSRWDSFNCNTDTGMPQGFPYPLSKEMYDLHFIRGEVKRNGKRTIDVVYEAVSRNINKLKKKDLIDQNFNIFHASKLPAGAVIVSSEEDIDYVAGMPGTREEAYKKRISELYEKLQLLQEQQTEIIPDEKLLSILPDCLKLAIEDESMEEMRKKLLAKFRFQMEGYSPLQEFINFRIDFIERSYAMLSKKRKDGQVEIRIDSNLNFVENVLLRCLRITGDFEEKSASKKSTDADGVFAYKFIGSINGLKKLGMITRNHPEWKDPFVFVRYFDSKAAEIGEYYDNMAAKYEGKLPFPINPEEALNVKNKGEWAKTFSLELGDEYNFSTSSSYKVLYDVTVGRISASPTCDYRNFGFKSLRRVESGANGLLIEILKPYEASTSAIILFTVKVVAQEFGAVSDVETGLQVEQLRDV